MSEQRQSLSEGIPASLVDVAETFGVGVALTLMQHFGGLDLKFPLRPGPAHPIIKALGEKAGRALCDYLGGQSIYIPHGQPHRSVYADVKRLEAKGLERGKIARMLGVSERHVRRMSNRTPDPRQPDLFD